MIFEKATSDDALLLERAMREIRADMDDPTMYVIDIADDIRRYIDGRHGFALLAKEDEELAGYFIFRFPKPDEDGHLGDYLTLSTEQKKQVVYMDSAGVFPKYRGQGLQGKLLRKGEALLKETSYTTALATVSPENPASLHTLLKNGFEIITTAEKYGGLMRHVLYKKLV